MMPLLALMLLLQIQSPAPRQDQIVGPYTFREDKDQTTKVILRNGVTVLVREQSAVPLVNITTHVRAGYFDEEDRVSGISHVIEHMFFKGTERRPVGQLARETRALGGYLNAYTNYDRTVYRTTVPAENAAAALDIQADALWRPTFDADELKKEIEVVLQENNRKLDNPSAVASEKLYATAFEQHRMKRWRIGTAEGLRALTRDDLIAYYRTHYRPSNIILAIVGQVDREKILEEVVKLYGSEPQTDDVVTTGPSSVEPEQKGARHSSDNGPIEQAHIAIGFHTPGILSEEAPSLEVLAAILGSGRASRLLQYLRDQRSLITDGSASLVAFRDLGFFEINSKTLSPAESEIAILAEVEAIRRSGVTNEELGRAKASIAKAYLNRLETVDGVGDEIALNEAISDWKRSATYLADIQKVTLQNVVDVARKYLTVENLSAFEYLPAASKPLDFQTAVLDRIAPAAAKRAAEPRGDELPVTAEIPELEEGLAQEIVGNIQRRSILRGPEIYIQEDRRLPIVSFGFFYPGGRLYETSKNSGITELMLRSALRGSRRFDAAAIARRLENAGATIQIINEPDFFGYVIDGIAGKMDQALDVLIDVLQQPTFDEQQIASAKALQITQIKSLRDDNYVFPVSLFMKTLFGEHAYARQAVGTEEAVSTLTNTDLRDWFRNNARTLVPSIVIVGDTEGTGLIAPLADALTNEDLFTRDMTVLPAVRLTRERGESVQNIGRQQTAMVYGFPGASHSVPDRYALEVLSNIVSGLGGRFFEAIREKQGLAYTVRTANASFAKSGALFTYTAFSPDKEPEVRAALDEQYARLRKEGVTREEVEQAIDYTVGLKEIALQTRSSQVLELARAIYAGGNIQSATRQGDLLRSVTVERVNAAIRQYLDPAALRVGIVRGTQ